jgi:PHD/YefM family antitoxin component YafN of YafNO toxin-antitoxin module
MPRIIPIKDLKNTAEISRMCHESNEPVFVTKNGYSHLVIMSAEQYERERFLQHVFDTIEISERQIAAGEVVDAYDSFNKIWGERSVRSDREQPGGTSDARVA